MDKPKETYRDPATGQYAYWNKNERLCVCGHELGWHIAGGFECGTDPVGNQKEQDDHGRG